MIKEGDVLGFETENKQNRTTAPITTNNYSTEEIAYMIDLDFPFCNHCKRKVQYIEVR